MFQSSYELATYLSNFVNIHHQQMIFDGVMRWNINIEKLQSLNPQQKLLLVQQLTVLEKQILFRQIEKICNIMTLTTTPCFV